MAHLAIAGPRSAAVLLSASCHDCYCHCRIALVVAVVGYIVLLLLVVDVRHGGGLFHPLQGFDEVLVVQFLVVATIVVVVLDGRTSWWQQS